MSLDPSNAVQIVLGGNEVFLVESYSVSITMLTQPAAFKAQIGHRDEIKDLLNKYPPNTDFELLIGGASQFFGRTDGWIASGNDSGTSLSLSGRDSLAPIHDAYVDAEKTFTNSSILDVVNFVFDKVLGERNEVWSIRHDATTSRLAMSNASGKKGKTTKKANKLTAIIGDDVGGGNAPTPSGQLANASSADDLHTTSVKSKKKKLQAKIGMKWYGDFLKPQLDRAGVFLRATGKNIFVLSELDPEQSPTYRIENNRGNQTNVIESFSATINTAMRYVSCTVHGRAGGGKEARTAVKGVFVDEDMTAAGFTKAAHVQDDKCTTIAQCEFLARKYIAESRRSGRELTYTVGGHTTVEIGGSRRVVWIPDTVVNIHDEELGINRDYYIESVEHSGSPAMTTTLKMMRPEDVVFGDGQGE